MQQKTIASFAGETLYSPLRRLNIIFSSSKTQLLLFFFIKVSSKFTRSFAIIRWNIGHAHFRSLSDGDIVLLFQLCLGDSNSDFYREYFLRYRSEGCSLVRFLIFRRIGSMKRVNLRVFVITMSNEVRGPMFHHLRIRLRCVLLLLFILISFFFLAFY